MRRKSHQLRIVQGKLRIWLPPIRQALQLLVQRHILLRFGICICQGHLEEENFLNDFHESPASARNQCPAISWIMAATRAYKPLLPPAIKHRGVVIKHCAFYIPCNCQVGVGDLAKILIDPHFDAGLQSVQVNLSNFRQVLSRLEPGGVVGTVILQGEAVLQPARMGAGKHEEPVIASVFKAPRTNRRDPRQSCPPLLCVCVAPKLEGHMVSRGKSAVADRIPACQRHKH
mmetsp:Transcript_85380/g.204575  ORF Transcript_85380/g.204575 Transcript_85380/m.204575 type:complete len:230 (+) Transcript_85380:3128-3817(+)